MMEANLRGTTNSRKSCHYCYFCFSLWPTEHEGCWVDGWCRKLKIQRQMYQTNEVCDFWLDEIETEKKLDASYEKERDEDHGQTERSCM
jgi:hypothetical protein